MYGDYVKLVEKTLEEDVINRKAAMKKYGNDPLYKAVIDAKNQDEAKKAIDTLIKIRGKSALANLKKVLMNEKTHRIC